MKMIVMGVIASSAVCLLISPISARRDLWQDVIHVTDSYADLLAIITRSFLTGSEEELHQHQFINAINQQKSSLKSLKKNLKEAKYEYYIAGRERKYHLVVKLGKCMERLAHNLGGLRSAATTQFLLLSQPTPGAATPADPHFPFRTASSFSITSDDVRSTSEAHGVLTSIDEAPEDSENGSQSFHSLSASQIFSPSAMPTADNPADVFARFMAQLGPSLVRLIYSARFQIHAGGDNPKNLNQHLEPCRGFC